MRERSIVVMSTLRCAEESDGLVHSRSIYSFVHVKALRLEFQDGTEKMFVDRSIKD